MKKGVELLASSESLYEGNPGVVADAVRLERSMVLELFSVVDQTLLIQFNALDALDVARRCRSPLLLRSELRRF